MTNITHFFRAIACISCLAVLINTVSAQTWPPLGMNGNGTLGNPWQITTAAQLNDLAIFVNSGYGAQTAGVYYKFGMAQ